MLNIGEERDHFGYDAVHDKHVDDNNNNSPAGGLAMIGLLVIIAVVLSILY